MQANGSGFASYLLVGFLGIQAVQVLYFHVMSTGSQTNLINNYRSDSAIEMERETTIAQKSLKHKK